MRCTAAPELENQAISDEVAKLFEYAELSHYLALHRGFAHFWW